jgi:hypothetical protein
MARDDAPEEDDPDRDRLSEAECEQVFDRLFPGGFAGTDVLGEIAPEGWEKSSLVRVFHPTLDQMFEERMELHRNLESFRLPGEAPTTAPTFEEIRADLLSRSRRVDPAREPAELVGKCVWDIFSDNHDATGPDGRVVDIGSFRGAAGFIAGRMNRVIQLARYGYLDFYMGTNWIAQRADLSPLYRMIFARMRRSGLDWIYHFPRIGLVTFADPAEQDVPLDSYDPSESIRIEEEKRQKASELARLQADLEEGYLESVEESRKSDPPLIVRSYQDVYGHLPRGWTPEA